MIWWCRKRKREADTLVASSLGNGRRVEWRCSQVAGGGRSMMTRALFSGTLYLLFLSAWTPFDDEHCSENTILFCFLISYTLLCLWWWILLRCSNVCFWFKLMIFPMMNLLLIWGIFFVGLSWYSDDEPCSEDCYCCWFSWMFDNGETENQCPFSFTSGPLLFLWGVNFWWWVCALKKLFVVVDLDWTAVFYRFVV